MTHRVSMGLLAIAAALLAIGVLPGPAGAARLRGTVESGNRPIGGLTVSVYRSAPGERPRVLARSRSSRTGRFALRFRPNLGGGALLYLLAGEGTGPPTRLATTLGTADIPKRVIVNELTTVATGYAFAQFVHGRRITGRRPGPQNASLMADNLASVRKGAISRVMERRPNGKRTSTLRTENSLANMIVSCTRDRAGCKRFLRLATPPGGERPRGVLQAVADIARYPSHDADRLFRLSRDGPTPYAPALRNAQKPAAWTVAVRFDGDGMSLDGPGNFAIDARGDIWVINNYVYGADPRQPVCGGNELFKFTPGGRFVPGSPYTGGGLSGAGFGVAIDPSDRVWVGNYGFAGKGCTIEPTSNSVSEFTQSGEPLSPDKGFRAGKISWPQGTVSDRQGNIWIANCGNDSVTMYPDGNRLAAANISGLGLEQPFDAVVGKDGRVFVSGVGSDSVAVLDRSGHPVAGSPITGAGLNQPMGLAVDSHGNVWVANSGLINLPCPKALPSFKTRGGSATLLRANGKPERKSAFTGGGMTIPWGDAVDGNNNLWVANFGKQRLSELCGVDRTGCPPHAKVGDPISPNQSGYTFDGFTRNTGVAIDPSGNVWVANNWLVKPPQTNPGGHQIVAFVGAAGPLRTPIIGPPR
jgi:sugar lactone lactonase YvrE